MDRNAEESGQRERYVLALIEATYPLQRAAADREVCLEMLIQAAEQLKQHLQAELAEFRQEQVE